MLNLNPSTLAAVVDQALVDAANHPRWVKAIERAVVELVSNPWIERQADHPGLIIGSTSGKVYSANGTCQCTAFEYGNPCWHRAAARIVRLHDEERAKVEHIARTVGATVEQVAEVIAFERRHVARPSYERAMAEMDELFA